MTVENTILKDCLLISPDVFKDDRGYFFESFNQKSFHDLTGISIHFVQDNQSKSSRGVLRGLHYQTGDFAQAKLVRVIKGKVLDVCVDIRHDSTTFGKWFSVELDDITNKQLYIPKGFAHGFLVLEDDTIFSYKCDNYYNRESEAGIHFRDPTLNIDWNFPEDQLILSAKDQHLPTFESFIR